jgi:hypothetical protein
MNSPFLNTAPLYVLIQKREDGKKRKLPNQGQICPLSMLNLTY